MKSVSFVVVSALLLGCGPSPEARAPMQMVRVESGKVTEVCDCEDVDEPEEAPPRPVEYVAVWDWQPPPSVQRVEEHVPPGSAYGGPSDLPPLTKHVQIRGTNYFGRYGWPVR